MSFSQDNGYTPVSFQELMSFVREGINSQFSTDYTEDTFVGTNWYKYFYYLVQKMLENETKTAEIFQKLQQYIALTNERIQRPSVSFPGLLESFADEDYNDGAGYIASVRPPSAPNAGKIAICVDVDDEAEDYADTKLEVATLIKDFVVAGMLTEGDQAEDITLTNGQEFTFAFYLPVKTPILLKVTAVESDNNLIAVPTDEDIRALVFASVNARYRLGWDFEPQRYYNLSDAPWAASVVLEWSDDDGATWYDTVFQADFKDLFTFALEDIQVVVT